MSSAEGKFQPRQIDLPFERVGLAVGDVLYLETLEPKERYPAKLIGYWPGGSILVSNPVVGGKLVLFRKDRPVTVRAFVRNRICAFTSHVKHVCGQPFPYLHLEYPRSPTVLEVRKAERVAVELPTQVTGGQGPRTLGPSISAILTDLSKTGAALKSSQVLGEPGQELMLRFALNVADVCQALELRAIIRNRQRLTKDAGVTGFSYGVEFLRVGDGDCLALIGFIYEQAARG